MKLAPSVRQISLVPGPAAILSAWYLSFVKLDGHFSITEAACARFDNGSPMNVAQRFDLFAHFGHQIVYYSCCPPFASRAYQPLFVEMMRNPLDRSALSLKLSRSFTQWNSVS